MASSPQTPGARHASPGPLGRRLRTLVLACAVLYLLVVAAIWLALPILGDRWWPATLFLFGPRKLVALPLLVLVPAALAVQRRALVPLSLASVLIVWPILGLSISLRALTGATGAGDLRVASFNAGSRADVKRLARFVAETRPDVLALQECSASTPALEAAFPGWAVHTERGMCLLSRHPLLSVESRDRSDVWRAGGHGAILRYTIALPDAGVRGVPAFTFVHLHLETPRDAIEALMHGAWKQAAEHDRNIAQRSWESELARQWVDEARSPVVVAGDFNMPVDSAIYRRFWAGFENAFSRAGLGFGATKQTRWFGVRIDHVLVGPGWTSERAWVGPDLGSDHLPILADLRWTGAR